MRSRINEEKTIPECYGTKEFAEKCIICKKCREYNYCKMIKNKKPRINNKSR